MKKMLLTGMLVVLSSLSFAGSVDKEEGQSFYSHYNDYYAGVAAPGMHKTTALEEKNIQVVENVNYEDQSMITRERKVEENNIEE